jgi:hypothetical protein
VPDTEEVTGSIPVSPTTFVQVKARFGFTRSGLLVPAYPNAYPNGADGGRLRTCPSGVRRADQRHSPDRLRRSAAHGHTWQAEDDPLPVSHHGRGHVPGRVSFGARRAVFAWITRYNTRRRHSYCDYLSAITYENTTTTATLPVAA